MPDKTQKVYTLRAQFEVKFTGNRVEQANFEHALRAIAGQPVLAEDARIGLHVALQNNLMISNDGVIVVDLQNLEREETGGATVRPIPGIRRHPHRAQAFRVAGTLEVHAEKEPIRHGGNR